MISGGSRNRDARKRGARRRGGFAEPETGVDSEVDGRRMEGDTEMVYFTKPGGSFIQRRERERERVRIKIP